MTTQVPLLLKRYLPPLSFAIAPEAQTQLAAYIELLAKWNKTYNLTAVRDREEMVIRHLMDSLAIAPYLHGERILDVGTGAGLPGIPLAIIFPAKNFTLMDSNGKKTRFLFQARQSLNLSNINVVHSRVEAYSDAQGFDSIVSRAFAAINDMLQLTQHLLAPGGRFLAMKGVYPEQEIQAIPDRFRVAACYPVSVPGLAAERHLVSIELGQA